jgi:serine phosphatase RsbU (regulator of sigma subunit)
MDRKVEIDYLALPLEAGDLFLLATDGVYEHTDAPCVRAAIAAAPDLDQPPGSSPMKPWRGAAATT